MRKRTIDKLLQAAIVEQAAEQGELWDREPVLEPIPEESQKRFDAALYGEPPKQTGAEDFFGQPAPKPAPEPKRRRVLAFALTGVSIAAVVLVVGLMIGVSRGEKGIKPDVLTPVHPDAQSTNAPFHAGSSYAPEQAIGVWETDIYDYPSLYLELFDDGTARILHLFGDYDIQAHYAWSMTSRNIVLLTFSDQTVVQTAELNTDTNEMILTLADDSTVKTIRAEDVVLPLHATDTGSSRNPITLPAVCPAYALGTSKKETVEGILFRYDLDGDGTEETISFRQSPEDGNTPVIVSIDETEYPLAELDARDKVRQAILLRPDSASEDLALVLTTDDNYADWNRTAILLLHGREVQKIKAETNDAYAYLQDGTLRITARCWLIGTYYGSRVYAGAELEPVSEWYETGVLDRVKDQTREEQIEFNNLFKVVRELPCTIDGKPAVIEPGTWVYLLRWKDTDDFAELETEDGRIITVAFTPEYDQYLDGTTYVSKYLIDGIDAEDYFDNLCMAG